MPVYEYECKACGRDFEYQQRMSDPDKTTCEVCGGTLDRLISRTAFALKGGGWYKDLYASPKPEKTGGAADASTTRSDAPAAGGGDKPAAAPAAPAASSSGSGSSGSSTGSTGSSAAAAKAS